MLWIFARNRPGFGAKMAAIDENPRKAFSQPKVLDQYDDKLILLSCKS